MRCFQRLLALCAAFVFVCASLTAAEAVKPVKYVFLFIGDGMSIPQRMMTDEFLHQLGEPGLTLNSFPHQVMTTTRSSDSFITDSAASGTAIACGEKTNNGCIGVNAKGEKIESTAEVARNAGRKVGIISSVTINHATPAAFYGHNASRGAGYALGLDLIASNFDFFAGGGVDNHNDKKADGYKGDIYDLAKEAGYKVTHDKDETLALTAADGKVLACMEDGTIPYAIDNESGLRIADYTKKAIELLDGDKGFFIMVEGGKIDWMCHANDAATTMREVIDLDSAVKVADDFAAKHPEETLIVVTGDHETGGLTLGFAGTGYKSYIERLQYQTCSQDVFTGKLAKLAEEKGADFDFDDVKPLLSESFGFLFDGDKQPMKVTDGEDAELTGAFAKAFGKEKKNPAALSVAAIRIFDNKAGLGWTSGAHTALPVNTSAKGPGSELFEGMIDNTDVAKILKQLVR